MSESRKKEGGSKVKAGFGSKVADFTLHASPPRWAKPFVIFEVPLRRREPRTFSLSVG